MRTRNELSSRQEIRETLDKTKEDMHEREVDLDRIATDVETVRDTLASLDFGGTREGRVEVEGAIKRAEDVTETAFDREDENLDRVQEQSEDYETGLEERQDSSEGDMEKISEAEVKTETSETKSELAQTKEAALRDIDFLKDHIELTIREREESENNQRHAQSRVRSGKA